MISKKSRSPGSFTPLAHQKVSVDFGLSTPVIFDCSDAGTGKTGARIWTTEQRIKKKLVRKVLVLAPKTLLYSVWAADFKKFAPAIRVAVSTAGKHEEVFSSDAQVYVTNIDAVKWLAKKPKKFFAEFDELIIDESTAYKHGTSARSKAVVKIAKYFKYRTCMTATPNSNSITDVWHQVKILDEGKRLGHSFFAFRNAVCTPVQVGRNEKAINWQDRDGAEEVVFGMLKDIVIRHRLDDCADIPPIHQYVVPYKLSPKQLSAYLQMQQHSIAALLDTEHPDFIKKRLRGKAPPTTSVTAIHAAAVMTKLLQIASGAVYQDNEKYVLVDTDRYDMVLDLVEARKQSLVFFLWKHQRDLLLKAAEARGISFALIDGSVKDAEREQIVRDYQRGMYRTVFGHPKSVAHGLTFTSGTATIWASPTSDLEWFSQGSRRQRRIGQTKKTENIIVVAQGTIEEQVYERLQSKHTRMSNLLELFASLKENP